MTYSDILFICLIFFFSGFLIALIGLLLCRIKASFRRKNHGFNRPAKFVPNLNLDYEKPPKSVDESTATDEFQIQGR